LTLARSDRHDDGAAKIAGKRAGEKLPAIAEKDRDAIAARDAEFRYLASSAPTE